ncbi:MAG: hypothetical protein GF355_05245, partial [Candidatus Eisenbacteria bacterium]|nr:hypothetical protein [Candidatus Eisenbacteria bacterium]
MKRMLLVVGVLLAAQPAAADVIHVPDDYATIQEGIDAAAYGDVVLVAAGEYFEEITLKAGVIVQGAGEAVTTINGGGDYGDVVSAVGNDITGDTKLLGFTVTGAVSGGSMPGGGGVFCNSGASPEIANNRITGNDTGIATWNNSGAAIHNNIVVGNTYTGISLSSDAPVVNNTVAFNTTGIYDSGGYGPPIMNNIIVHNSNIGLGYTNTYQPDIHSYNDVWNNGTDYHNTEPHTGEISADPQFADESGGDYHLDDGSPCIDAGNPDAQYNDPDGSRNDMGAYGGPDAEADIPEVSLVSPAPNSLSVPRAADASAVFSVEMDPATLTAATCLLRGEYTGDRLCAVFYDAQARMVTIDPQFDFRHGEVLTASLTRDIASAGGTSLDGFSWQFTAAVSDGSGKLGPMTSTGAGAGPGPLRAADVDGDGILDLIVSDALATEVFIFRGAGDGTFTLHTTLTAELHPAGSCCGDFNGDGDLDIAVACLDGAGISVFLGAGGGSFAPAVSYAASGGSIDVCCADFDHDGDLDLATADSLGDMVTIFSGAGDGSFGPGAGYPVGAGPFSIAAGDLNRDGIIDLVTANRAAGTLSALPGLGDATFGSRIDTAVGGDPPAVRLADFDGDGVLDAAATLEPQDLLWILRGDETGSFQFAGSYPTGNHPHGLTAGDLNADGYLDIAVANQDTDDISIFLGRAGGQFTPGETYAGGDGPWGIVHGDVDADGDLDICVGNVQEGAFGVLRNEDAVDVAGTDPDAYELHVPPPAPVTAVFDAPLDPGTVGEASFILEGRLSGPRSGVVSYDGGTYSVTLDPALELLAGEQAHATLTTAIQGAGGTPFAGFSWTFTAAVSSAGDGVFTGFETFSAGTEPRGIWAADLDADADVDLALCSSNYPAPGAVVVLLNEGDGSFGAPSSYNLAAADPLDLFGA